MVNDTDFEWNQVIGTWSLMTLFLILFIVHHFILMPWLFLKKRYMAYCAALIIGLALFTARLVHHEPGHFNHRPPHHHMPHERRTDFGMPPPRHDRMPRPPRRKKMLTPPDIARLLIALMMIGVDLGGMAWINSRILRQRLLLLERQNLKQELEHLRYQINPHFFMNTLNNIHVLIDIDQERAKQAVIELSRLMRHSLYNGSESVTPLQNEVDFLRQYISLMQLRFGNRVEVKVDLPDAPSLDILVPPLLFATFVENAFKHGISYQTASYIHMSLSVDSQRDVINFKCENSRSTIANATNDGHHGIGLHNVRKRLDLQYADSYSLAIDDSDPQRFAVELTLPILKA